jgi:hypothetical protein
MKNKTNKAEKKYWKTIDRNLIKKIKEEIEQKRKGADWEQRQWLNQKARQLNRRIKKMTDKKLDEQQTKK